MFNYQAQNYYWASKYPEKKENKIIVTNVTDVKGKIIKDETKY